MELHKLIGYDQADHDKASVGQFEKRSLIEEFKDKFPTSKQADSNRKVVIDRLPQLAEKLPAQSQCALIARQLLTGADQSSDRGTAPASKKPTRASKQTQLGTFFQKRPRSPDAVPEAVRPAPRVLPLPLPPSLPFPIVPRPLLLCVPVQSAHEVDMSSLDRRFLAQTPPHDYPGGDFWMNV